MTNPTDLPKSRSQSKREYADLKQVIRDLVELPASRRRQLQLPEAIDNALDDATTMTRGALQRQIRFITKVLRDHSEQISAAEIKRRLLKLSRPDREQKQRLHTLETWRDRLLHDGDDVIGELARVYPAVDRQQVRQLVRKAHDEARRAQTPKAARRLYQLLNALIPNMSDQPDADTDANVR